MKISLPLTVLTISEKNSDLIMILLLDRIALVLNFTSFLSFILDNKSFQNDLLITMNQETFSNVQRQPTFR